MRINEITNYGAVPKGTDKISTKQNITTRTTQAPSGRSSEKVSTRNIRNTQNTGTTDVFKRSVTTTNPDNTRSTIGNIINLFIIHLSSCSFNIVDTGIIK